MVDRETLWLAYCTGDTAICKCCRKNVMVKNDSKTWHRGHILGDRYRGTPHIENMRPLCVDCNNDSKPFATTYGYMASIGTMSHERAKQKEQEHREMLANLILSDSQAVFHCIGKNKDGARCTLNKVGKSLCYNKHKIRETHRLNVYARNVQRENDYHEKILKRIEAEDPIFFNSVID